VTAAAARLRLLLRLLLLLSLRLLLWLLRPRSGLTAARLRANRASRQRMM